MSASRLGVIYVTMRALASGPLTLSNRTDLQVLYEIMRFSLVGRSEHQFGSLTRVVGSPTLPVR